MDKILTDLKELKTEKFDSTNELYERTNSIFHPQGFRAVKITGKKSNTFTLFCHRSGKPRELSLMSRVRWKVSKRWNCPFKITFSLTSSGWELNQDLTVCYHNHSLLPPWSKFTPEIIEFIKSYELKTTHWKMIQDLVNNKFNWTFTYDEVYYRISKLRQSSESESDNKAILLMLEKLKNNSLIDFRTDANQDNSRIVLTSESMKIQYKLWGKDILIVDTTFGTNSKDFKLWAAVWISNEGKSLLVGFGLLKNESYDSYNWIFENFFEMMKDIPNIVMTDSDPAIKEVFKNEFPHITHYLCGWHVQLNIKKHISNILKSSKNKKEDAKSTYSELVNLPFEENKDKFDRIWNDLLSGKYKLSEKILSYFINLLESKSQWSIWYRENNKLTLQVFTSSRIESIFAYLKHFIRSKSNLYELWRKILVNTSIEFSTIELTENSKNKSSCNSLWKGITFKLFEFYQPILEINQYFSDFTLSKCLESLSISLKMKWTLIDDKKWQILDMNDLNLPSETVKLTYDHFECSCIYSIEWGLPWWHIFAVSYGLLKDNNFNKLEINNRWRKLTEGHLQLIHKNAWGIMNFFDIKNSIKSEVDKNKLDSNILKYEYLIKQEFPITQVKEEKWASTIPHSNKRIKSFVEKIKSKRLKHSE